MKPGDLVVWSKYAAAWSDGPEAGDFAGTVVRVIPPRREFTRLGDSTRRRPKAEILDDTGTFIVTTQMVNIISSVNSNT